MGRWLLGNRGSTHFDRRTPVHNGTNAGQEDSCGLASLSNGSACFSGGIVARHDGTEGKLLRITRYGSQDRFVDIKTTSAPAWSSLASVDCGNNRRLRWHLGGQSCVCLGSMAFSGDGRPGACVNGVSCRDLGNLRPSADFSDTHAFCHGRVNCFDIGGDLGNASSGAIEHWFDETQRGLSAPPNQGRLLPVAPSLFAISRTCDSKLGQSFSVIPESFVFISSTADMMIRNEKSSLRNAETQ